MKYEQLSLIEKVLYHEGVIEEGDPPSFHVEKPGQDQEDKVRVQPEPLQQKPSCLHPNLDKRPQAGWLTPRGEFITNPVYDRLIECERSCPAGWIEIKTIKGQHYLYYRWRDGKKMRSRYLGKH